MKFVPNIELMTRRMPETLLWFTSGCMSIAQSHASRISDMRNLPILQVNAENDMGVGGSINPLHMWDQGACRSAGLSCFHNKFVWQT